MKTLLWALLLITSLSHASETATYRVKAVKDGGSSWGTAVGVDLTPFKLTEKRYLITAYHVVEKHVKTSSDQEILVDTDVGWIRCEIIESDPDIDLVLLKAAIDLPRVVELDESDEIPSPTDELVVEGSPRGIAPRAKPGKMTKTHQGLKYLVETSGFDHGCSGGPVYRNNKLVGITPDGVGTGDNSGNMVDNQCWMLPVKRIRSFLK